MKIALVTDGNNLLGMGHIYQSLSMAAFLSEPDLNHQVSFFTKSADHINDFIRSKGYPVTKCDNDEEIFQALQEVNADRIIFDKLDVAPELALKIKTVLKKRLAILTNLTEANAYADVAVLADYGSNFENINRTEEDGRKVFFGPKYWLLRPEFYKYNTPKENTKKPVRDIMLIFGGSDPCNYSTSITRAVLEMDEPLKITLVLGGAFEHENELNQMVKEFPDTKSELKIIKNMTNVAESMHNSDVVFASPGLSYFEALAVGTPVVGFHQNELQQEAYADKLRTYDDKDVKNISSLIKNKDFLYPEDELIISMAIGKGKDEIINAILN